MLLNLYLNINKTRKKFVWILDTVQKPSPVYRLRSHLSIQHVSPLIKKLNALRFVIQIAQFLYSLGELKSDTWVLLGNFIVFEKWSRFFGFCLWRLRVLVLNFALWIEIKGNETFGDWFQCSESINFNDSMNI